MRSSSFFSLFLIGILLHFSVLPVAAQRRSSKKDTAAVEKETPPKTGIKAYGDVITDKAITDSGLLIVHKVEDKWYWELPDSIFGREMLVVSRISKSAAGLSNGFSGYAGDIINSNVIRFDKGPKEKLFLKQVSYDKRSTDESGMYKAVVNSNLLPIIHSFEIKAMGKDSGNLKSYIIDVTDFIEEDNEVLFFNSRVKSGLKIGGFQKDKSYVEHLRSFPMNTEIKTVKTYSKSGSDYGLMAYTLELNSSIVLLPSQPARPRYYDPRVGYFTRSYTDFDANPQGVKEIEMAVRWKLEPKPEDIEKYKKGILVEPKKPIVFYIDPATPKKWVPYLIEGVNDWQAAFEQAGFKNAIMGKPAPTREEDSTWSLEDARYSAIVYKPSEVQNASGPNVHDPRSGEILESHINWYHNVMELLRNWYFIQTSPTDSAARKMVFDEALMGELIRFVSAHEVGHTLGLRHNFGSSSTVPVDSLRNKKWVEANGHTPSIMDYARFNYVAQPEDKIGRKGLFPRIGDYDKWAIEWGYRWMPDYKNANEEAAALQAITTNKLKNKRLWFGTEINPNDPRSQNEDLGDNAMKAGQYGIKNLQRIIPQLINWTKQPNEGYELLSEMYDQVVGQFGRYLSHAAKNIGGIYETPKMNNETGAIYEFTPKTIQQDALKFLNRELFITPSWLIDPEIFNKTGETALSVIGRRQELLLGKIINTRVLNNLFEMEAIQGKKAYRGSEFLDELRGFVFSELRQKMPVDRYRRSLQKTFTEQLIALLPINEAPSDGSGSYFQLNFGPPGKQSDLYSLIKGNLRSIRTEINGALPLTTDVDTKLHLLDLKERITMALEPR
ncbi:MAG: zinc-dependent metalloprotease [Bacteroidetes bacterium]|nr:zinc-dependent metalloprotease [Bacteroidota bacterium]